ncbi:peptidoglycan DD-metalloendopeptidase family protein [Cytobacillus sp. FSL M8-0252]|uniref:M23 family metallopeptidase n=1 Tax=Cytobacillus sp. FSL M8-0252 TaxID=2921621 RepID=UPI0030FBEF3C
MKREHAGWLVLLLKNPVVALVAFIVIVILALVFSTMGVLLIGSQSQNNNQDGQYPVACQAGDLNEEIFESQFDNAGVFTGMADVFLSIGYKHQVDPVLLASIAFHETGRGTSKMVVERNNPGGLYNSSAGSFFVYSSLEEGIDAMASNLYRLYIGMGLLTIEQIGAKYAPIGVENDPNNLNIHWVPNVSKVVASFGGLSMNCEVMGLDGSMLHPIPNAVITSEFGTRVDPFTGSISTHKGVDFGCSVGQSIFAAMSGTVYDSRYSDSYGNVVILQHGDKYTLYAHMTQNSVDKGESVKAGQQVGTCGSTGNSTGPHLHFEIQLSPYGQRIDPLPYLQGGATLE